MQRRFALLLMVDLKELARVCTLSGVTKECRRAFLHQIHRLLSTVADLEALSLHDWQQENNVWFQDDKSQRQRESGRFVLCDLRGKALSVTAETPDMHCSLEGEQKCVSNAVRQHANKSHFYFLIR